MALEDSTCAQAILCALAAPVRNALVALAEKYRALVQLELAAVTAKLAALGIVLAPVEAVRNTIEDTANAVREGAQVLPLAAIGGCLELGDLNIGLERTVQPIVDEANAVLDDLERLLSLREELEFIEQELVALDALLGQAIDLIGTCGS